MTFEDMLPGLHGLMRPIGARPDVPMEAEAFFSELVGRFDDSESCSRYVSECLSAWFRFLGDRPDWIQDPQWLWDNGKPMVFVGSIDPPPRTFHSEGRFYLFWSPETGATDCVIQVV